MKKVIAIIIAAALTVMLAVPAFATGSVTAVGGSNGADVKGKYTAASGINKEIYSIAIAWGGMEFNYAGGTWDPDTHAYTDTAWTAKDGTSNIVTVTNHSNKGVAVNVAFAVDAAFSGKLTGTVTGGTFNLAAPAAGSAYTSAPTNQASLAIDGNLGDTGLAAAGSTLGRITVIVSAP